MSILALDSSHLLINAFPAGRSGCGKSFLLLQVVQHCASTDWIVIYIPRAVNLVNSTNSYVYDIRTQTYLQTEFALQTLQRMLTVNSKVLDSVQLHEDLELDNISHSAGELLTVVIRAALGAHTRRLAQAPFVLEAVMKSIEKQTK